MGQSDILNYLPSLERDVTETLALLAPLLVHEYMGLPISVGFPLFWPEHVTGSLHLQLELRVLTKKGPVSFPSLGCSWKTRRIVLERIPEDSRGNEA